MKLPHWRLRTAMIAMALVSIVGMGAVDLARLLERRADYLQQANRHQTLALQSLRSLDNFAEQAEEYRKWLVDGARDWPPYANTREVADLWRKEPEHAEQAARRCDRQVEYQAALTKYELGLRRKYLRAARRFWTKPEPDPPPPDPPRGARPSFA